MNPQTRIDLAALLLRLSLGVLMLAHGLLKVLVFTIPGTVGFFASLGLPGWLAYGVILVELLGGVLLIIGVKSRWASLALLPVLLGAWWAHAGNGWLFSNANGGWEFPALLVATALVQWLLGSGRYALMAD
ncbi:MAG: DoxX family protein [Wenzhouxiangellaceae bacterium]